MSRLDTMARFDPPDSAGPEFHCGGCGYAFDLPREGEDVHACDCGRDLCSDCAECEPCRKLAEREEELRELAELAMRSELRLWNLVWAFQTEIVWHKA